MIKRLLFGATLVACGGRTGSDANVTDAGDASIAIDASADTAADVDTNACDAAVAALGNVTTAKYCTSLLRVSTIDRALLGGSIVCGAQKVATDADARAAFAAQIPPYTMAADYQRVGPTGSTYDFVFYHPASDFGGIGVVALATSSLVFSGQLSWSATGKILFPTTFLTPSQIVAACTPVTMPDVHAVPIGAEPDASEVARVVDVASRSALVRAVMGAHAIVHTLVVLFPVDGSPTGTPKNEWLVVFDSGQLE